MIQFEHVSKSYGKTPVLKDLNFTIPDGQFVVLIGPSGCGKTTTMKMINRLLEPDTGTSASTEKMSTARTRWNCGGISAMSSSRSACSPT